MRATGYLPASRSGVDWLIDPDHPRMIELGEALRSRTPQSAVDAAALAQDVDLLPGLIRERHAFAVLGRCAPEAADDVLARWRTRLLRERPTTWAAAVGEVVPALREALGDNHLAVNSDTTTRPARPAQGPDPGPAWESRQVTGVSGEVSLVRIRTLSQDAGSSAALLAGSADESAFFSDRVVVDLRGNGGGDDSFVSRWMAPMVRRAFSSPTITCLSVGQSPLMVWNYLAFLRLRDPEAPPPSALLPLRHTPHPGDELTARDTVEEVPVGRTPWQGRMLVLVDGGTASSGESAAWLLREGLGARIVGGRTAGMFESANMCPYVLPHTGLTVLLPSQWVRSPEPVEFVGLRPDAEIDVSMPLDDVAGDFEAIWATPST